MGGRVSNTSKALTCEGNEGFKAVHAEMEGKREGMEDRPMFQIKSSNHALFGICDGHAGSEAAEFVSNYLPDKVNFENVRRVFRNAEEEFKNQNPSTSGTTVLLAQCFRNSNPPNTYSVHVSNLGDSRCILIKQNGIIIQITDDHTPANKSEEKRILDLEGTIENGRVGGILAVSRAIGDFELKPYVSCVPDCFQINVEIGDLMLLACDGIFEQLDTNEVGRFIITKKNLKMPLDEIAVQLLDFSLEKGSRDNMSVILVEFGDGREWAEKKKKFLFGKFHELSEEDKQNLSHRYFSFAERHGVSFEEVEKHIHNQ